MLYTTLAKIRDNSPCSQGWKTLLKNLNKTTADDEPLDFLTIINSNGIEDAIWCLRSINTHEDEIRVFGVECAKQIAHLVNLSELRNALEVSERYVHGKATKEELNLERNKIQPIVYSLTSEFNSVGFSARIIYWTMFWGDFESSAFLAFKIAVNATIARRYEVSETLRRELPYGKLYRALAFETEKVTLKSEKEQEKIFREIFRLERKYYGSC